MKDLIRLEEHKGITVLRDDLLPGGTKSVILDSILDIKYEEYVYATPVYGGFQIALAIWCKKHAKRCVLFCAQRKDLHQNTLRAIEEGATIVEVPHGYLSVVESHAKKYSDDIEYSYKIPWGAHLTESIELIASRAFDVLMKVDKLPDDIFIALGSGMITEGILLGSKAFGIPPFIKVHGVQVGAEYIGKNERLILHKYHKSFDKKADTIADFPSMPNYDLKAWEYCKNFKFLNPDKNVMFWNVL